MRNWNDRLQDLEDFSLFFILAVALGATFVSILALCFIFIKAALKAI